MRRRLIVLGVVGFWLVMMATLVRHWLLEVRPAFVPGTYRSVLTPERRNYQERMGIYWRGQRVGHTQTVFAYRADGSRSIENVTHVRMAVPGLLSEPAAFDLDTTVVVGADLSLERLTIRLHSGATRVWCVGSVVDGKLVMRPTIDGQAQEPFEFPMPSGEVVSQGLSPLTALPPLSVGVRWSATAVDPFTLEPSQVEMRVLRREELQWEGQSVDTHVVEVQSGMWMRALARVSREGEVLKQRLPLLGLTFVREPIPEEARAAGQGAASADK